MFPPEFSIGRPATPATPGRPGGVAAPAVVAPFRPETNTRYAPAYETLRADIVQTIRTGFVDELGNRAGTTLSAEARAFLARQAAIAEIGSGEIGTGTTSEAQREFLERITPWAQQAGAQLGVAPDIIAAQAALESGWGQRPIRQADGSDSFNFFSIKATGGWQGETADVLTTEFENGVAVKRTERFRSYPSPADAFDDFARLIQGNPRYQAALNTGNDARAFGLGLARGGYATDPRYADKLDAVVQRMRSNPNP